MKLLALACLALSGCTILPTQHGKAIFTGDYAHISFDDGSVHFRADAAIHSNVVRAHWHGVTNLGAEVVTGAIGLHGGNQIIGAAGAAIPPMVNRPTNRATPSPKP